MKFLKHLLVALVLLFGSAFAHGQGGTVPTIENGPWVWQGVNVFDYGNLQLASPPPSCPGSEFVDSIDETFTLHCSVPAASAASPAILYPTQCGVSEPRRGALERL